MPPVRGGSSWGPLPTSTLNPLILVAGWCPLIVRQVREKSDPLTQSAVILSRSMTTASQRTPRGVEFLSIAAALKRLINININININAELRNTVLGSKAIAGIEAGTLEIRSGLSNVLKAMSPGLNFQPTTQPTNSDALHDFRVVRQSPRSVELLKSLIGIVGHGRGQEVESPRAYHFFQTDSGRAPILVGSIG
jgi:hypothetical protein